MNCNNCGGFIQPGMTICPYCSTPVNGVPVNNMQPMNNMMPNAQYAPQPKKKHTVLWVILGIIGVIVIGAVILILTSKKLKCSSSAGSFTVYYTSSNVWACTTTGAATCDLSKLQESVKTYGLETVIELLETEAKSAGGTCTK